MRRALLAAAVFSAVLSCKPGDARSGGAGGGGTTREFDGARAMTYVERQIAFGPRVPNTAGHRQMGDWLAAELASRADTVLVQQWRHVTSKGHRLELRNFIARFRPTAADRVLLVAHWDTRPTADQDSDEARKKLPIPGANDGASGVAVLLGIADALKRQAPAVGVDLLFVDGEDYGSFDDTTESLLGARYYARHQPAGPAPMFAVVLDMVGDKDLQFYYEGNSNNFAPEVVKRVWQTAERLGYGSTFIHGVRHTLTDDHLPLQQAGIHAIDVIDFDYPPWHTMGDTADKLSAESLAIVGNVMIALVR